MKDKSSHQYNTIAKKPQKNKRKQPKQQGKSPSDF